MVVEEGSTHSIVVGHCVMHADIVTLHVLWLGGAWLTMMARVRWLVGERELRGGTHVSARRGTVSRDLIPAGCTHAWSTFSQFSRTCSLDKNSPRVHMLLRCVLVHKNYCVLKEGIHTGQQIAVLACEIVANTLTVILHAEKMPKHTQLLCCVSAELP